MAEARGEAAAWGAAANGPVGRPRPPAWQLHWFSFLSAEDLANCGGVCKAWLVLVNRAFEAEWTRTTGVPPPRRLPRSSKLMLLKKLRDPLAPDHFQFLLTMAAGRRGA